MKFIARGWRAVLSLPAVVFVFGCDQSPTSSDRVPIPQFSIAPGSGSWTTKAPMPTGRTYPSVGVVNGIIYAVGGVGNFTELTVNEAYDPTTDSWSSKASAPTGVDQSAAAVVSGVLYVVSGSTGFACQGSYVGTISAYVPVTHTWTPKAQDPTPRCGAAAAAV